MAAGNDMIQDRLRKAVGLERSSVLMVGRNNEGCFRWLFRVTVLRSLAQNFYEARRFAY